MAGASGTFDIESAVPIVEKAQPDGTTTVARKPEFDIHSSEGVSVDADGMTAFEHFASGDLEIQAKTMLHEPIDDLRAKHFLENQAQDQSPMDAFKESAGEGIINFVRNAATLAKDALPTFSPLGGLARIADKTGAKLPESDKEVQAARAEAHPIATTLGQIVGGVAPFIVTAPIFPESLIGLATQFVTVGQVNAYGQQQAEGSVMDTAGDKIKAQGKQALFDAFLSIPFYYAKFIPNPKIAGPEILSKLAGATGRSLSIGAATTGLSAVFGNDLSSALKEGGIMGATMLMFETLGHVSPAAVDLTKTALGRGIWSRLNKIAKKAGVEVPDIPLDQMDAAAKRTSLGKMIGMFWQSLWPRVRQEAQVTPPKQLMGPSQDAQVSTKTGQGEAIAPGVALVAPQIARGPISGGLVHKPQAAPMFYSKLMATIAEKMGPSATPDQVMGVVKASGVPQDEVDYSGLENFVTGKAKIDKAELLKYLDENRITIEETIRGGSVTQNFDMVVRSPEAQQLQAMGFMMEVDPEFPSDIGFRSPNQEGNTMMTSEEMLAEGLASEGAASLMAKVEQMYKSGYSTPEVPQDLLIALRDHGYEIQLPEPDMGMPEGMVGFVELNASGDPESLEIQTSDEIQNPEARQVAERIERVMAEGKPHALMPKYQKYTVPGGTNYREMLLQVPNKSKTELVRKTVGGEQRYNFTGLETTEFGNIQYGKRGLLRGDAYKLPWSEFQRRIPYSSFNVLSSIAQMKGVQWKVGYAFPYEPKPGRKAYNVLIHGTNDIGTTFEFVRLPGKLTGPGTTKIYVDGKPYAMSEYLHQANIAVLLNLPQDRINAQTKMIEVQKPIFPEFRSSHWEEKNVFAHIRMTDRTDVGGRKGLFGEEFQADWNKYLRGRGEKAPHPAIEKWLEIALKRFLRYAAENNYAFVSWATGKQTADHYNLAKYVDEIRWWHASKGLNENYVEINATKNGKILLSKAVAITELDDLIGKDAASKIKRDIENKVRQSVLTGEDLQIGGHWAVNLYDQRIPNFMNDYLKKYGVQVETVEIPSKGENPDDGIAELERSNPNAFKVIREAGLEVVPSPEGDLIAFADENGDIITASDMEQEGTIFSRVQIMSAKILEDAYVAPKETETLIQQAVMLTPSVKQAMLGGQPILGKAQADIGKENAPSMSYKNFYKMSEDTTVLNTHGKEIKLPKGEIYRTMDVHDSEGRIVPGKVTLVDGKQVTVFTGELNKLKGDLMAQGSGAQSGGRVHPELPEITRKDFNQEKKPLPEDQILIDQILVDKMNELQEVLQKRLVISSGFRTREYNDWLRTPEGGNYKTDPESVHMSGRAADIDVKKTGLTHQEIAQAAWEVGLNVEAFSETPKHVHVELPTEGSPTPLEPIPDGSGGKPPVEPPEAPPAAPEDEPFDEEAMQREVLKEIEAEANDLKERLKDHLTGKLNFDLQKQGEYADLKHLKWLWAKEGTRGWTPDELIAELQDMGFAIGDSDGDVLDLIKTYFKEDVEARVVEAVGKNERAAKREKLTTLERLVKKGYRELARVMRRREIEAAKMVSKIGKFLSTPMAKSKIKAQIRIATGQMQVNDVINEDQALKRMMQREQAASAEGYRAGRNEGVAKLKQHQAEIRERKRNREIAQEEVKALLKDLKHVAEHPEHMPIEYQDSVKEWLDPMDLKKRSNKTLAERDSRRKFIERMEAEGQEVNIPQDVLDQLEKVTVNELTVDGLREVHEAVMRLYTLGKLKNKMLRAKIKESFDATVQMGAATIAGGEGITPDSNIVQIMKENNKGMARRSADSLKAFVYEHIRPEVIFQMLDGWTKGTNTQVVWDTLFNAWIEKLESSEKTIAKIKKILEPLDQTHKTYTKKYKVLELEMTKDMMYKAYALSFNEMGLEKLANTGLSEKHLMSIDRILTVEEKDAIHNLMKYYADEQWAALDKVAVDMTGVHMGKEDFYFPLVDLESKSGMLADIEDQILKRSSAKVASVAAGMTKGRVSHKGGFKKMSFFGDVLKNWEQVEHYKAFAPAIRDARKYLGSQDVRTAIEQKYGRELMDIIDKWLKDVAYGGDQQLLSAGDKWIQGLRTNFVKSVLSLNLLSPLRQGLGILPGVHFVGQTAITKGILKYLSNPIKYWKMLDDKFVMLRQRAFTSEREMKEMVAMRSPEKRLEHTTGAAQLIEYGMYPLVYADKVICHMIALSAYDKTISEGGSEEAAVAFANEAIRRTQNMGELMFLADAFRGDFWHKLMTTFRNENNQNFNLQLENLMKTKAGEQGWLKFLHGVALLLVVPGLLYGMSQRKRWQDNAGEVLNDLAGQALGGMMYLTELMPLGKGQRDMNPITNMGQAIKTAFSSKKPIVKIDNAMKAIAAARGIPYMGIKRLFTGQPFGKPAKSNQGSRRGSRAIYQ